MSCLSIPYASPTITPYEHSSYIIATRPVQSLYIEESPLSKPVSIALVGVGGYAANYLSALLDNPDGKAFTVAGIIDPFASTSPRLADIQQRNIPIYNTLEEFYNFHTADLTVVSTPIHLHCPHTCTALNHGSHVLCEKPIAATIQEADRMIDARDRADKLVAIGYQWSFDDTILALKKDISAQLLGAPRVMKTLTLWPRDAHYYSRNTWAGRIKSDNGDWILDSPINNAVSHHLHCMFYLLGDKIDRSARPVDVQAELYRANKIENLDTAAIRCHTDKGVEVLFYTTHACKTQVGPVLRHEFEKGVVCHTPPDPNITVEFKDGSTKDYGNPYINPLRKLWHVVEMIESGGTVCCGLEAARSQTLAVNGAHDAVREIVDFPPEFVQTVPAGDEQSSQRTCVDGLDEVLQACFEQEKLPGEMNVPWSKAGKVINLEDYRRFPGG